MVLADCQPVISFWKIICFACFRSRSCCSFFYCDCIGIPSSPEWHQDISPGYITASRSLSVLYSTLPTHKIVGLMRGPDSVTLNIVKGKWVGYLKGSIPVFLHLCNKAPFYFKDRQSLSPTDLAARPTFCLLTDMPFARNHSWNFFLAQKCSALCKYILSSFSKLDTYTEVSWTRINIHTGCQKGLFL